MHIQKLFDRPMKKKAAKDVSTPPLTRAEICKKASAAASKARKIPPLTESQLETILEMARVGILRSQIAMFLRVGEEWLRDNYGAELDIAKITAVAKVAGTLFARATDGKDLGAAIFYLKAQGGWREVPKDDPPPANPDEGAVSARVSLNKLSAMIDRLADGEAKNVPAGVTSASDNSENDFPATGEKAKGIQSAH